MKRLKLLSLGVSTLFAIALAGCEPQIIGPLLQAQESGKIQVTGSGSVVGEPDIATLRLGVSIEKETVAEAREAGATAMTEVIASLKANGIADNDIQTERFSIHPEYDYTENKRVLRGYRVNNTVSAKVRELENLSEVIDAAAEAGGDIIVVNSIQFMIEDTTPMQAQARGLAVKNAEAKAQTLADASGVKLGKPVAITETISGGSPPIAFARSEEFAADSARSSTPIEAGELTIVVNVTVVYGIE